MCLIIKSGPHIASKDIYTLKMGEYASLEKCSSFFMNEEQNVGELLTSDCVANKSGSFVGKGLHSICDVSVRNILQNYDFKRNNSRGIYLCRIPKGSEFYIGRDGDIVSDCLILDELIVSNLDLLEEKVNVNNTKGAFKLAVKILLTYGIKIGDLGEL